MTSTPDPNDNDHRAADTSDQTDRPAHISGNDPIESISSMLDQHADTVKLQGELEMIPSILERHNGSATLATVADEMGAKPSELAVPIDLLHNADIVRVSGSGIRSTISLIDKNQ